MLLRPAAGHMKRGICEGRGVEGGALAGTETRNASAPDPKTLQNASKFNIEIDDECILRFPYRGIMGRKKFAAPGDLRRLAKSSL